VTDAELTRAVEQVSVANAAFRHVEHLRVAWVYLQESASVEVARERMAATLRRYAAATGHADKYSDALTAFWMYQLAAVRALMPTATADEIFKAFPRLLDKQTSIASYSPHDVASRTTDSSCDPSDRAVPR
jgi:hypothetical protein